MRRSQMIAAAAIGAAVLFLLYVFFVTDGPEVIGNRGDGGTDAEPLVE